MISKPRLTLSDLSPSLRFLVSRTAGQTEFDGVVPVARDDHEVAVGNSGVADAEVPATATDAAVAGFNAEITPVPVVEPPSRMISRLIQ